MRKKLIGLLKSNQGVLQTAGISATATLRLADLLVANGVTIPVRCQDCRFFEQAEYYTGNVENPGFKNVCRLLKRQVQLDGFCSYGERKDK